MRLGPGGLSRPRLDRIVSSGLLFVPILLVCLGAGCQSGQDSPGSSSHGGASSKFFRFQVKDGQGYALSAVSEGRVASQLLVPEGDSPGARQLHALLDRGFQQSGRLETVSARALVPFFRFPVVWSLDPDVGPQVLQGIVLPDPGAAYVTDSGVGFQRLITFPRTDGEYVYLYTWNNGESKGFIDWTEFSRHKLVYRVLEGGTRAQLLYSAGLTDEDLNDFQLIHDGALLNGLDLRVIQELTNAFGYLLDDEILERAVIGTYAARESFTTNGGTPQETALGQFDVRMLSVKNLRVQPPAPDEPVTTLQADVAALPRTTVLFDGWQPAGSVSWRIGITDLAQDPPAGIRVLSGESPVSAPDSSGKVAALQTTWDGTDGQGVPRTSPEFSFRVQALAPLLGGGNTKTRSSTVLLSQTDLKITRIEFPSAFPVMDDEGQPISEPTLYYSEEGDVHHPVAIPADSFTSSARADWSGRHVPGGGDIVVKFDLNLEGRHGDEPVTYELRVLDPDGEPVVESEVLTFPPGQDTLIGYPIPFHLEKKVQGIRFVKFERRRLNPPGPWKRVLPIEGLQNPLYVTLTTPRPPLNSTDRKPTIGLLDITTHLASGATTDTEIRERALEAMAGGWLKSKRFTYNVARTHFKRHGAVDHPTGGRFDYVTFMQRFNDPSVFWEGDCEDLACLYQLCCATAGADMNLIQVTSKDEVESFSSHPLQSAGFQEVGNPGAENPRIPVFYNTPVFRVWWFPRHQCGSFAGLAYDPTFVYSQPPPEHLVNGIQASTWFSQHLVWTADWAPAFLNPEFPLTDVVLP